MIKQKTNIDKKMNFLSLAVLCLFFVLAAALPAAAQATAETQSGTSTPPAAADTTAEPAAAEAGNEPVPGTETLSLSKAEIGKIEKFVKDQVAWGKIPGLSVVIVKGNQTVYEKGFGFADIDKQQPVTPQTLFELASCSKAFTGLAILQLEGKGLINLDDPVSKYIPWLKLLYQGQEVPITIAQFLHQSSGIPTETIGSIPPYVEGEKALEDTVRTLVGSELVKQPGQAFLYATINYDVLGLVIQQVSGMSYEEYIEKNILQPLKMEQTVLSRAQARAMSPGLAVGYKLCLKKLRPYEAPIYGGNVPAGYVISNAVDLARWLKIQMGTEAPDGNEVTAAMIEKSHISDPALPGISNYGAGWFIFTETGLIAHSGDNPNFSSFLAFTTGDKKMAAAVLANTDSNFTSGIGQGIMSILQGEEPRPSRPGLNLIIDNLGTMIFWILAFFSVIALLLLVRAVVVIIKEKRKFSCCRGTIGFIKLVIATILVVFVFLVIWNIPVLLGFNVPLSFALIWQPFTFGDMIRLMYLVLALYYLFFLVRLFFPRVKG